MSYTAEEKMIIGANICRLRKERGLTQIRLANLIDVTESTVGNWESGKSSPRFDIQDRLCAALHTSWIEIESGIRPEDIPDMHEYLSAMSLLQNYRRQSCMCMGFFHLFVMLAALCLLSIRHACLVVENPECIDLVTIVVICVILSGVMLYAKHRITHRIVNFGKDYRHRLEV